MKTQTKINYLTKARDLIADKNDWCQGHNALDRTNRDVHPKDRKAKRFCAQGAILKVVRDNAQCTTVGIKLADLLDDESYGCVVAINDNTSTGHAHRRVMGVFNRAIKKLRKQLEQGE